MRIGNVVRSHTFFILITSAFVAWLCLLFVTAFFARYSPSFYDVLHQTDVTGEYSLQMSPIRIILEPLEGLVSVWGASQVDYIYIFFVLYGIVRFVIFMVNRVKYHGALARLPVVLAVHQALDFFFFSTFFLFLTLGGFLVVGVYPFSGYIGLANAFMNLLLLCMYCGLGFLGGSLAHNLYRIHHPKSPSSSSWLARHPRRFFRRYYANESLDGHPGKKIARYAGRELINFLMIFALFGALQVSMLTIPMPVQNLQTTTLLQPGELLLDLHIHTTASDGTLTPEQRVLSLMNQGLQGAAFSDHFNVQGARRARDFVEQNNLDFIVITAQEYTSDCEAGGQIHLNIYNIDINISPACYGIGPNLMNCSEMIQYVKAHGGYVTVNHYTGAPGSPYTYDQLRMWGVDGFEVANSGNQKSLDIRNYCLVHNLICMGGSDTHENIEVTTFIRLQLPDPNNQSVAAIFDALYDNNHEVVIVKSYPTVISSSIQQFRLVAKFINYFLGLTPLQSLSWIIWSFGGYLGIFAVYQRTRRLISKGHIMSQASPESNVCE